MIKKAFILAGGEGLRLRPLTLTTPKPLLKIQGKTTIEWVIENLKQSGIEEVTLIIGYKADMIKKYFGDGSNFGVKINYFVETEPLGTGGALKNITKDFTEPFIVYYGDNLIDLDFKAMCEFHESKNAKVTIGVRKVEDISAFGAVEIDENNKITSFVEKPKKEEANTDLANIGCYIINPGILDVMPNGFASTEKDCFQKISHNNFFAFLHDGQWFPTDKLELYNKAKEKWCS